MIAKGVSTDESYQYQNQNFALFRVIIPYLNGFSDKNVNDRLMALANAYLSYLNQQVFGPAGIKTVTAKPDAQNPTLFYPFPAGSIQGIDFGDSTLFSAGSGIHLSMDELNQFLSKLRFTDTVLNAQQRKLMDDNNLGWYRDNVTNGTQVSHGGYLYYPSSNGDGSLKTSYYDFSIGAGEVGKTAQTAITQTLIN
ncbi:serine hydrolase domain-containing protein [Spirosoma arcticum]